MLSSSVLTMFLILISKQSMNTYFFQSQSNRSLKTSLRRHGDNFPRNLLDGFTEERREPIICQIKRVIYEIDNSLDINSQYSKRNQNENKEDLRYSDEREWHCIENVTENFYVIDKLPSSFEDRYGHVLQFGNSWVELSAQEQNHAIRINMARISISSEKINIRILNLFPNESTESNRNKQEALKFSALSHSTNILKRTKGKKKILIARVTGTESSVSMTKEQLSDAVFGTHGDPNNLKSQYEACSYKQLELVPAEGLHMTDGVVDINLLLPVKWMPIQYLQLTAMAALRLKVGPLIPRFDHILLCLPPDAFGTWIAYGYINGILSVYRDEWCSYVSSQMHEVGHNFGLDHAGLFESEYGDTTGMMGYSYESSNFPLKCFNAANSWKMGWYEDKSKVLHTWDLSDANEGKKRKVIFSGKLIGTPSHDYPMVQSRMDTFTLIKIQPGTLLPHCNIFIMFNEKSGMNWHTSQSPNKVTVVRGRSGGKTDFLGGLDSGDTIEIQKFIPLFSKNIVIEVCDIVPQNDETGLPMHAEIKIYKKSRRGASESQCLSSTEEEMNEISTSATFMEQPNSIPPKEKQEKNNESGNGS